MHNTKDNALFLALRLRAKGCTGEAVQVLAKIVDENSSNFLARAQLAQAYLESNDAIRAIETARSGLQRIPSPHSVRCVLASVLDRSGLTDEALHALNVELQNNPRSSLALYAKGDILLRRNDVEGAIACLESASAIAPGAEELMQLSMLYRERGQHVDSERLLRRLTIKYPRYCKGFFELGNCLALQSRSEDAHDVYQRLLERMATLTPEERNAQNLDELNQRLKELLPA